MIPLIHVDNIYRTALFGAGEHGAVVFEAFGLLEDALLDRFEKIRHSIFIHFKIVRCLLFAQSTADTLFFFVPDYHESIRR